MAIKKFTENKWWRGCGEKGALPHCWWEGKLKQPLWRTVWRFLRKLKIEWPYDPAIPLLGTYPDRTTILKDKCTPVFTAALFIIAKTWKQTNAERYSRYIQRNTIKKNNIIDICSNVDAARGYHTEWNKSERERQLPYITYMWNLKYDTNERIYEAETDTQNRPVVARGEQVGEEWIGGLGLADANPYI